MLTPPTLPGSARHDRLRDAEEECPAPTDPRRPRWTSCRARRAPLLGHALCPCRRRRPALVYVVRAGAHATPCWSGERVEAGEDRQRGQTRRVSDLQGAADLSAPPCVVDVDLGGGTVRQVLSLGGPIRPAVAGGHEVAGRFWPQGGGIPVSEAGTVPLQGARLTVDGRATRWSDAVLSRPADVLASWHGRFSLREPVDAPAERPRPGPGADEPDGAADGDGLRVAQAGALHAVLAYWSTRPARPATVVLPTGSGKTEVMLALLVAARLPRLLVLVPSDALREQIAGKFETLGLLFQLGVVDGDADRPVVGRLRGSLPDAAAATAFAGACNVVVATTQALMACTSEVRAALTGACSHLFVDEAHHVAALTWASVREAFDPGSCVQFTATPFREDGRHLGGQLIYNFPLREAQRLGYFTKIRYLSVFDLVDPDAAVAARAVAALREDLAAGHDHLLMARAASRARAEGLLATYAALAPDLGPVVLHSGLSDRRRTAALSALRSRGTRIVLCVDMLGEGFDMPQLKVAAMHDEHRSLGVTLQFVGRFTRSGTDVGEATFVSAREQPHHDPRLARLYAQDRDWDLVIQELATGAIGAQEAVSEFEQAFAVLPEQVSIRAVTPKMSTVVYRTRCQDWTPDGIIGLFGEDALLTTPPAVNERDRVVWFVAESRVPVRWTDLHTVEEVTYALYVAYWDEPRGLLFVNCSANDGTYRDLARALCGEDVSLVAGPDVYRAMHGLERLVATTVGVTDVYSRTRRFSFHVGADVADGFPSAEATTKTQTNIYAAGFDAGTRVGIGASLKGRIWSHRVAPTIKHWVDWCDAVGGKVTDPAIDPTQVMDQFIRPEPLDAWPDRPVLAVEWPAEVTLHAPASLTFSYGGVDVPADGVDLAVVGHEPGGPVRFDVVTEQWRAGYELALDGDGMRLSAVADEVTVATRRNARPLSEARTDGLTVVLGGDALVVPPGLLIAPRRDRPRFDPDELHPLDWSAIDPHKESRHRGADEARSRASCSRGCSTRTGRSSSTTTDPARSPTWWRCRWTATLCASSSSTASTRAGRPAAESGTCTRSAARRTRASSGRPTRRPCSRGSWPARAVGRRPAHGPASRRAPRRTSSGCSEWSPTSAAASTSPSPDCPVAPSRPRS